MDLSRRHLIAITTSTAGMVAFRATAARHPPTAPRAYGALPSARQLAWHRLETYGFLHFTVNTFIDREWGLGDEDPKIFNPSDFSADQIVSACRAGGLKQLILTAKHHDGFCLWPSAYTEHSVKNSPYKGGRGDIVGEIAASCHAQGVKFGVYLSPWDRNHAQYGRPEYVSYYHNQLRELLTHYGPLHEIWFDGANGGDGYYGGAREVRAIDGTTYYQWDKIRALVRELQPDAVMFGDALDVRWVGNEAGLAGDPCWPTMDDTLFTPEKGNRGVRGGPIWNPAETDVSIRPGWFWHADEDDKVRSPANLLRLYSGSTGRGTNLLLNVPPDQRGRIAESDAQSLKNFRAMLDQTYARNLNANAQVTASSQFSAAFAPIRLPSGGVWAAKEDDTAGAWIELALPTPVTFDLIRLREELSYGARVDVYAIEVWRDGGWDSIAQHSCIGAQRLIHLDLPVTAQRVRLRVLTAAASPVISEFSLYHLPDIVEEPRISRDWTGMVTLTAPSAGLELFYTQDGTPPSASATVYTAPFALPEGGTVKAIARKPSTGGLSAVTVSDFDVAPVRWRVVRANGDAPDNLVRAAAFRGEDGQPVEIVIDLAQSYDLKGFTLRPVADPTMAVSTAEKVGPPVGYKIWVSTDGTTWGNPIIQGEFANVASSRSEQKIRFASPQAGRYLRLLLPRAVQDKPTIAIGGVGILTR